MKKNLISVIVPVYNVENYLRNCLDSIVNQKYSDIEIILVDDGSKDGSGYICDDYASKDSRIKVLHKENGGVSKARNAGIDLAQGEFLSFIDGDDTIDFDYLSLMYNEMILNDVDIVRLAWERGGRNYTYHVKFDQNGRYLVNESRMDDLHLCENRWGLFKSSLNIRFNEMLKNGEDSLYVVESFVKSKRRRMLLVNQPLYHYREVVNSASDLRPSERIERHQKYFDQALLLKNIFPQIDFLVKKHIYTDYFLLMCDMIDRGISHENGFSLSDVEKKVCLLRMDGAKDCDIRAEIKYILYRYRLISFFKVLKFFQKFFASKR